MENLDCINRLKNSPMLAMSLGSKELFHSNFWAWIMENADPDKLLLHLFFEDIDEFYKNKVYREQYNIDLTVWTQNSNKEWFAYIIENKYKSIPDRTQLERYQKEITNRKWNFVNGVLTGIEEPEFNMPEGWKFVSYNAISSTIRKIADKLPENNSNKAYLEDYSKMLEDLSGLLKVYGNDAKDSLPLWKKDNDLYDAIGSLRLWDLCQKHQEQYIMRKIITHQEFIDLNRNVEIAGMELEHNCGFNNSKYSLDLRIVKDKDGINRKALAIQIEGNQYRVAAEKVFPTFNKEKNSDEVYKSSDLENWFITHDGIKQHSKDFCVSSMRDNYCKYNGYSHVIDEDGKYMYYSFVYQYWNIDETNNQFDVVFRNVMDDLKKGFEILKRN